MGVESRIVRSEKFMIQFAAIRKIEDMQCNSFQFDEEDKVSCFGKALWNEMSKHERLLVFLFNDAYISPRLEDRIVVHQKNEGT